MIHIDTKQYRQSLEASIYSLKSFIENKKPIVLEDLIYKLETLGLKIKDNPSETEWKNIFSILREKYKESEDINIFYLSRDVSDYLDQIDTTTKMDYEAEIKKNLLETIRLAQEAVEYIQKATQRVDGWDSSYKPRLVIAPLDKNHMGYIVTHATFYMGDHWNSPNFLIWYDGQGHIQGMDDILDGNDFDFFKGDLTLEKNYFDLIKEIENPGSSQKGKDLVLYTARPIKDRALLDNATKVPPYLFLANKLDHVEGLAYDLGYKEYRDIYKIVINSKYLVEQNLGAVKYYQIINNGWVPVKKMELILEGGTF
jgi:hypothetical protein